MISLPPRTRSRCAPLTEMPRLPLNLRPRGNDTVSDFSFGAFFPRDTLNPSAGLPLASPVSEVPDSFGAPRGFGGGGHPATRSRNVAGATFPFWPVLLACRMPEDGAQVASSAALGPPNSVTTSAVWGTSGRFENVTV